MAKRNYSRKGNKIQPAVQRISLVLSSDDVNGTHYCDLSQIASIVNRRFYRQGINWAVAGFTVISGGTDGPAAIVNVSKLPNTWIMSNAWEKGFRAWNRMNSEALSETPSVRPKFLDFKIYADAEHHALGSGANLLPWSIGSQYQPGEWTYSKISHPLAAGTSEGTVIEENLIAVGANFPGVSPATGFNAVSLIEGYAASRGLPNIADPNTPDDASDTNNATPENWITAMFNDGTEQDLEVITDMINDNTIAPYPFENDGVNLDTMYPGGANQGIGMEFVDQAIFTSTTIGGKQKMIGSNFPCGLIRFDIGGFTGSTNIFIDLIPGNHRGYLCEPMTEM